MFDELIDNIDETNENDIKLYFITRVLKEGVSKRKKMLDKYNFKLYQVDVDDEIRNHFKTLTLKQIKYQKSKDNSIVEYDVISDDTSKILTYNMRNSTLSFKDVVEYQINQGVNIPKVGRIEELFEDEELWAYGVEFQSSQRVITFRKIQKGKVAIDENNNPKLSFKTIRTIFDTSNQKLMLLKGETIYLDKKIDCVYIDDTFYVISKFYFEQMVGLEQEYKQQSEQLVTELEGIDTIEGLEILKDAIAATPSLHRKLVKVIKLGEYKNLTPERIDTMIQYSKENNLGLKTDNGKLKIEDATDIDNIVKFLADYYKDSQITGNKYGTFAGTKINQN